MSRRTHFVGLSENAQSFLCEIEAVEVGKYVGLVDYYNNESPIYFKIWQGIDKEFCNRPITYAEVIQADGPWNGGPFVFTYLLKLDTVIHTCFFQWTEEEINKMVK